MGRLVQRFGRVVPAEILDARAQADAMLAAARRDAAATIDDARAEAAALREEARRQGDAAGRAQAEAAFTDLLVAARVDAERVRAAAAPAARVMAMRMAEKIVGRAVHLDDAVLVDIVAQALAAARPRAGVVEVRVHPDDQATLTAARPALAARLAAAVELRLVVDPSVGRAGCVVDTPAGRLDARLAVQLDALERAVFGDKAGPDDAAASAPPRAAGPRG